MFLKSLVSKFRISIFVSKKPIATPLLTFNRFIIYSRHKLIWLRWVRKEIFNYRSNFTSSHSTIRLQLKESRVRNLFREMVSSKFQFISWTSRFHSPQSSRVLPCRRCDVVSNHRESARTFLSEAHKLIGELFINIWSEFRWRR